MPHLQVTGTPVLDHQGRLGGRYPSQQKERNSWDWTSWIWDVGAFLLAAILLGVIAWLLNRYDMEVVPHWPYSINLTTLISLLATLIQDNLMVTTGRTIAQSKWAWYSGHQARPLQDLQAFDEASRTPWGAVKLLPRVFARSRIALLAACVMISSLAIGPFVQQAVTTINCNIPVPGTNASLPYAHYVPRQGTQAENSPSLLGGSEYMDLEHAIYTSLNARTDTTETRIGQVCPTGNCTIPKGDPLENSTFLGESFSTIGMCSSCVDVTSLVIGSNMEDDQIGGKKYQLPNGLEILSWPVNGTIHVAVRTDKDLPWLGDLFNPEFAQASHAAIANITLLTFSEAHCGKIMTTQCPLQTPSWLPDANDGFNRTVGPISVICTLYPCIRRTIPSLILNQLSEIAVDTSLIWPVILDSKDKQPLPQGPQSPQSFSNKSWTHYAGIQSPCRVDETIYTFENMSTAPNANATQLLLLETLLDGTSHSKNVSAPEPCIYRHDGPFAETLSLLLQGSPTFEGLCISTARSIFGFFLWCGSLATLQAAGLREEVNDPDPSGAKAWMKYIYDDGNATVPSLKEFFESFAVELTNKYRSVFGSSIYNDTVGLDLPPRAM